MIRPNLADFWDRAQRYNAAFPMFGQLHLDSNANQVNGVWLGGNRYQSDVRPGHTEAIYGAYPPFLLRRLESMFDDISAPDRLHLFSGSLGPETPGTRFDINPKYGPDVIGDANCLSQYLDGRSFRLILADPPYSKEHAKRYGYPMPNITKVVHETAKVVADDGYLLWLSTRAPMWSKNEWDLVGTIFLMRSSNHEYRGLLVFRRA